MRGSLAGILHGKIMFSVYLAYWMGEKYKFFCLLARGYVPSNFSDLNVPSPWCG